MSIRAVPPPHTPQHFELLHHIYNDEPGLVTPINIRMELCLVLTRNAENTRAESCNYLMTTLMTDWLGRQTLTSALQCAVTSPIMTHYNTRNKLFITFHDLRDVSKCGRNQRFVYVTVPNINYLYFQNVSNPIPVCIFDDRSKCCLVQTTDLFF